jgi:hypothetical protein
VERVLVCILAKTRAHELTFPSFKRQVLDGLSADLALALAIDENYDYANPFWQHAKYRWTAPDFTDYGEGFDLAQRWLCHQHNVPSPDWRTILRIKGIWQGRIQSADPQPSASSILTFCRWLLLHNLQEDQLLDRYDRFVITRSDFIWLCPHPPLSVLDRDAIWFPDGEHYGGLTDRHLVVSRSNVVNCLNVIEDILLHPLQLYNEMKYQPSWNNEQFLAHHLVRKGIRDRVKLFPYVMYTARSARDLTPTWSAGNYQPALGHSVKYETEFRKASAYSTIIRSRSDWEQGAWTLVPPPLPAFRQPSLPRRLRYGCKIIYYKLHSALRRPGRADRLVRFCWRMAQRFDSPLWRPGRVDKGPSDSPSA